MAVNRTKTQQDRLFELDRQIRAGKYPNCEKFARDYEVSPKTILRDIEYLRNSWKAPLAYDYTRKGYYYTDQTWRLPAISLTESEFLQLLLAGQMAEQLKGTPLAGTLSGLFEKLRSVAEGRVTVDPALLRQQVSFHNAPMRPLAEPIWSGILRGLNANVVIEIEYRKVDTGETSTRKVEPIHLACVEGDWYLIALDRTHGEIRHFLLSRVKKVRVTDEPFESRDFDPKTYFLNRLGRHIGDPGKGTEVRLRFTPEARPWVEERQWHPLQKTKINRDGSITLTFPAPELFLVASWVLQWGTQAKVLGPPKLRDIVVTMAQNVLLQYRK